MSRYRKVEVRMWGDRKFKALTPMPPCGRGLWIFLLTGPHTTNIPGVFAARQAGLAEELGWTLPALRRSWAEIEAQSMALADWDAGLVWLPNAIEANKPESPNVVRSWGETWSELPECALKEQIGAKLRLFVESLGEGFAKAFREAFGEAFPKALLEDFREGCSGSTASDPVHPSANQEQEQDQEQEQERKKKPPPPAGRRRRAAALPLAGGSSLESEFATWWEIYPDKNGRLPALEKYLAARRGGASAEGLLEALRFDIERRQEQERLGRFVEAWPHAKTWLRQRRWEDLLTQLSLQHRETARRLMESAAADAGEEAVLRAARALDGEALLRVCDRAFTRPEMVARHWARQERERRELVEQAKLIDGAALLAVHGRALTPAEQLARTWEHERRNAEGAGGPEPPEEARDGAQMA